MRLNIIIAAVLLGGCSGSSALMFDYYKAETAVVPANYGGIRDLKVQLHPTAPERALVFPANHVNTMLLSEDGRWQAELDLHRKAYGDALLSVLKRRGETCEIDRAELYPATSMIEFNYRCQAAAASAATLVK